MQLTNGRPSLGQPVVKCYNPQIARNITYGTDPKNS